MRYLLAAIAAPLGASLCLMTIATTGASAQVTNCWMAPSPGPPIVNDAHILCGEVRQDAVTGAYYASGFHSRHNGANPVHTTAGGQTVQIISNDGNVRPVRAMPDIYKIRYFNIRQGIRRTKPVSTMFPDHCSPAAVLAAIRNATGQQVLPPNATIMGMSGTGCLANGSQFDIIAFTDGNGHVDSAYPDY